MAYFTIGLLPILIVQIAVSVVLILGGRAMMTGRSYGLAMTAGVLALVPTGPIWLLSLPMGIWALWTLTRPDVKAAFGRPSPAASSSRGVFIVLAVLGGIVVLSVVGVAMFALSFTAVRVERSDSPPIRTSPQEATGMRASRVEPKQPKQPEQPPTIVRQPWQTLEGQYEHETAIVALAFHPSGNALASVEEDGRALFWNPETGEQIQRMDNVGAVAYSADGRWLAVGDANGKSLQLFDASNHKSMVNQFNGGPKLPFKQLAFNPDGNRIAALSRAGETAVIQVWDTTGDLRTQLPDGTLSRRVVACVFRDFRNLVFVDEAADQWIWDTADEKAEPRKLNSFPSSLVEGGYTVTAVAFRESKKARVRRSLPSSGVTAVAFRDSKKAFFAGLDLGKIYLRTERGPGTTLRQAHPGPVRALAYGGLSSLASAGEDGVIRVWRTEYNIVPSAGEGVVRASGLTIKERHRLEGLQGPVTALAWSPDGRLLASGGADRTVRLWRLR